MGCNTNAAAAAGIPSISLVQLQKYLSRIFKTAERKQKHQWKLASISTKQIETVAATTMRYYTTLKALPCAPNIRVCG
jgi:hypothetical protein